MKLLLISGIGLFSAFVASAPGNAADMRAPAPVARSQPAPASTNWSGGQVGGNGGGSIANNAFVEPGSYLCSPGTFLGSNCFETPFSFSDGSAASAVGGGFIGYRWQFGNTVIGIEGDALWKKASTSASQLSVCPFTGGACGIGGASRSDSFYGTVSQGWEGSIRGRYGILVTPNTLLYGTGGVSFGEVSGSFNYFGTQPVGGFINTATAAGSWRDTRVGGTVGVGAETQWVAGIKVRAEYRFTHYGSYSKDVPLTSFCPGGCGGPSSSNAHIDVNDVYNHKFLLGIGWDFGS
jgi:outer membrane immunogenic protein